VTDNATRSRQGPGIADVAPPRGTTRRLAVEAALAGLAYGSVLCWLSTCVVGSFRPGYLANPYWPTIPALRTDTCGIAAFAVAAASLGVSEFLRLRRKRAGGTISQRVTADREAMWLAALAMAETLLVLSTFLVAYLSVNAVTHPATLALRATHLVPWPTEGTLRVIALAACACSMGVSLWIRPSLGGKRVSREPTS
jgi:hypothetical protein